MTGSCLLTSTLSKDPLQLYSSCSDVASTEQMSLARAMAVRGHTKAPCPPEDLMQRTLQVSPDQGPEEGLGLGPERVLIALLANSAH